jgi:hypothetical protein
MKLEATITDAKIIAERSGLMRFNPTTRAMHYPEEGILKIDAMVREDPNILSDVYTRFYAPGHKIIPTELAADENLIHIIARLTTVFQDYKKAALHGKHIPPGIFEPIFLGQENLNGQVKKLLLRISKTLDEIKDLLLNQKSQ